MVRSYKKTLLSVVALFVMTPAAAADLSITTKFQEPEQYPSYIIEQGISSDGASVNLLCGISSDGYRLHNLHGLNETTISKPNPATHLTDVHLYRDSPDGMQLAGQGTAEGQDLFYQLRKADGSESAFRCRIGMQGDVTGCRRAGTVEGLRIQDTVLKIREQCTALIATINKRNLADPAASIAPDSPKMLQALAQNRRLIETLLKAQP